MPLFNFLKPKQLSTPPLSSLRPHVFKTYELWHTALIVSLVIFFITLGIAAKLFLYVYFEGYKKEAIIETGENVINVDRLNRSIEKRDTMRMEPAIFPADPSI